jgi:hypothetical protein
MTAIKRRDLTITALCLVPDDTSFSRTADLRGCWMVPDDDSLIRTRFASQEEQEVCCQLIEEGCEIISFWFVQKGQAIVMKNPTPLLIDRVQERILSFVPGTIQP